SPQDIGRVVQCSFLKLDINSGPLAGVAECQEAEIGS
ncbi:hypothetical protein NPIL_513581, partial [Nephila pilipes]